MADEHEVVIAGVGAVTASDASLYPCHISYQIGGHHVALCFSAP